MPDDATQAAASDAPAPSPAAPAAASDAPASDRAAASPEAVTGSLQDALDHANARLAIIEAALQRNWGADWHGQPQDPT